MNSTAVSDWPENIWPEIRLLRTNHISSKWWAKCGWRSLVAFRAHTHTHTCHTTTKLQHNNLAPPPRTGSAAKTKLQMAGRAGAASLLFTLYKARESVALLLSRTALLRPLEPAHWRWWSSRTLTGSTSETKENMSFMCI